MQTTPSKRQHRNPSPPRTPSYRDPDDARGQLAHCTPPELAAKLSSIGRNARFAVSRGYANGMVSPSRTPLTSTRSEPFLGHGAMQPSSATASTSQIFSSSSEMIQAAQHAIYQLSPTRPLQPMCETLPPSPASAGAGAWGSPTKASPMGAFGAQRMHMQQEQVHGAQPGFPGLGGTPGSSRKAKRVFSSGEVEGEPAGMETMGHAGMGDGLNDDDDDDDDEMMDTDDHVPRPPLSPFRLPAGSTAPGSRPCRALPARNRAPGASPAAFPAPQAALASSGNSSSSLGRTQSLPADVFRNDTGF